MRLYQIVMKVPDDFIPDDMKLQASYDRPIEVCSEGFIGDLRMVECEDNIVEDSSFLRYESDIIDDINEEEYYQEDLDLNLTPYDDGSLD